MRTHRDPVELAIAFEPDQHTIAQVLTGTQELRGPIPPIGQDDDRPAAKERFEGPQLANGDRDGGLLTADTLLIQDRGPTADLLGDQHHRRKRPADADGFVHQRQIRQMDDRPIGTGWGVGPGQVARIDGNPDGLAVRVLRQQRADPQGSDLLDIDAPIGERFIATFPLPLKKGRQRQFWQRLGLTFTQEGIPQIEQSVGSPLKARIELLTYLLQCGNVHFVRVLCFGVGIAKNFTLSGSFWQAKAAFWVPLV